MNKKLIFYLSLLGIPAGFATVFILSSEREWIAWALMFFICSVLIARECDKKYFLHGFSVALLSSVWITAIHIAFYDTYIANHPGEVALLEKAPLPYSVRISMLLTGPVTGALYGLVLGLLSYVASKTIKQNK